jgi:hypothetical protein
MKHDKKLSLLEALEATKVAMTMQAEMTLAMMLAVMTMNEEKQERLQI